MADDEGSSGDDPSEESQEADEEPIAVRSEPLLCHFYYTALLAEIERLCPSFC